MLFCRYTEAFSNYHPYFNLILRMTWHASTSIVFVTRESAFAGKCKKLSHPMTVKYLHKISRWYDV